MFLKSSTVYSAEQMRLYKLIISDEFFRMSVMLKTIIVQTSTVACLHKYHSKNLFHH